MTRPLPLHGVCSNVSQVELKGKGGGREKTNENERINDNAKKKKRFYDKKND